MTPTENFPILFDTLSLVFITAFFTYLWVIFFLFGVNFYLLKKKKFFNFIFCDLGALGFFFGDFKNFGLL